nr:hypothetical protein [bacterium]
MTMPHGGVYPLTAAQQELWLAHQIRDDGRPNVLAIDLTLTGVRPDLLATALDRLIGEAEALRCTFEQDGGEVRQIVHPHTGWTLPRLDLSGAGAPDEAAGEWVARMLAEPVDPARFPLFSAVLIGLGDGRHRLFIRTAHLVCDGAGGALLVRRLGDLYTVLDEGGEPGPSPFSPLADVLREEHEYQESPAHDRDAAFWAERAAAIPDPVRLGLTPPTDEPASRVQVTLPPPTVTAIRSWCERLRIPVPAFVLAASAAYLRRYAPADDVVVGLPVAARFGRAARTTPSCLSNLVPAVVRAGHGDTFTDVARHAAAALTGLVPRSRERGPAIAAAVEPGRPLAATVGWTVNYLQFEYGARFGAAGVTHEPPYAGVIDDVQLAVHDDRRRDVIHLELTGAPGTWPAELLTTHLHALRSLVDAVLAAPDTPLGRLEAGPRPVDDGDSLDPVVLPDLFAAAVAAHPDAEALVGGDDSLTYRQLDAWSSRLARTLIARGAGPEDVVALLLPRSAQTVVALLAVLKAGAAYLPLDPSQPRDRLGFMLGDARPVCTLTPDDVAAARAGGDPGPITDADRRRPLRVTHPAHVIYTSGSTGRPKGVVVTHTGLRNLAADQIDRFELGPDSRLLQFVSFTFDVSVSDMWGVFLSGGTLVIRPDDDFDLGSLAARHRPTHAVLTPSLLGATPATAAPGLTHLQLAGEALAPEVVAAWAPGRVLINGYGPTEATVYATMSAPLTGAEPVVPIGRPVRGVRAYVLDAALRPVPDGAPGELFVAGPGLARGYLGRFALTAGRFVADPFAADGSRMYRTGDVVRRTTGGDLVFDGRTDAQVKIRGFRVEPGEIEAVLQAEASVARAVVVLREDTPGVKRLVGYLVATPGELIDTGRVREFCARRLPDYMMPAALVVLGDLPLTANGKLDTRALPAPVSALRDTTATTDAERVLAGLVAEVLGGDPPGPGDSFFALGGDSLSAMRLTGRIRDVCHVQLSVRDVVEAATVRALAARIPGGSAPVEPVTRRAGAVPAELSAAQSRMWVMDRVAGPSAMYNLPFAISLSGDLDVPALRSALADVVARHEPLRTLVRERDGRPWPHLLPAEEAQPRISVVEVAGSELDEAAAAAARHVFALDQELPVAASVFTTDGSARMLLLVVHHIAADGFSTAPFVRDLDLAYRARLAGAAPRWAGLPVAYADFADWQRRTLGDPGDPGSRAGRQLAFWESELAGAPERMPLPYDRPYPAIASFAGGTRSFRLPGGEVDRLARAHGTTPFMVLHASLAALLSGLGAGDDVVIGAPVAGRTDPQLDDLVGCFVNTVALRTDLSGRPSFATLLAQVRQRTAAALAHQDVPFDLVVERSGLTRSAAHTPLVQVLLAWQTPAAAPASIPGELCAVPTGIARTDLSFLVTPAADGDLAMVAEFRTDLFDAATIDALTGRWARLLAGVAADPARPLGDLDLLTADERRWALSRRGPAAEPPMTLPDVLARTVERRPDAVAVEDGHGSLTYAELDAASNRLARELIARGLGPEDTVAVALPRTADAIVAMVAVLKSGAAYLPLDPGHPVDRLRQVVADAGPRLAVTTGAPALGVPELGLDDPRVRARPATTVADGQRVRPLRIDHPAYVIYTSGSTGRPKGVVSTHRGMSNLLRHYVNTWRVAPGDRVLQYVSFTFDASVSDIWSALAAGATLVIRPDGETDLAELARRFAPTHAILTPSIARSVPSSAAPTLTRLILVGEALSRDVIRAWAGRTVINAYGPTEASVASTITGPLAGEGGTPPIGGALRGFRLLVLDRHLRPVPVGVPGELYVCGPGLARGYLRRPDLTAERFVAGPHGERMYRTGDVVRWTPDGTELVYLGRADAQVKIRGFRVEPGEIEATLAEAPGVAAAAVVVREDRPGRKRLVAYVVPAGPSLDRAALVRYAAARLPDYMVPSATVELAALPLTSSGKLDSRALPAPGDGAGRPPVVAASAAEEVFCELFAEVLGLGRVGADQSFFDLGGDSISAIQLSSRARERGFQVRPADVFTRRTPAELALVPAAPQAGPPPVDDGVGEVPLTPILAWLDEAPGDVRAFHQSVVVVTPAALEPGRLVELVQMVLDRHGMLRARRAGGRLEVPPPGAVAAADVVRVTGADEFAEECRMAARRLDPVSGVLFQAVWSPAAERLFVAVHHIAVDGVSWRVLLDDLRTAWEGGNPAPPGTSFRTWARTLREQAGRRAPELAGWQRLLAGAPTLATGPVEPADTTSVHTVRLGPAIAGPLLTTVPAAFGAGTQDILLAALTLAIARWRGEPGRALLVDLEGHGRAETDGIDLTRTVGWFTALHPVRIDDPGLTWDEALEAGPALATAVKRVKEDLRAIPGDGLGYGLLRYLDPDGSAALAAAPRPDVAVNYLGRFRTAADELWSPVDEAEPAAASGPRHALTLDAAALDTPAGPVLRGTWTTVPRLLPADSAAAVRDCWLAVLDAVVRAVNRGEGGLTPSDLSLVQLDQHGIDRLEARFGARHRTGQPLSLRRGAHRRNR